MNEDGRFIVLFEKFTKWEWYTDVNTKVLFLHCLLKANWKPGRFKGHTISRGQFVTSLSHLSRETGLTTKEVRTALNHLIRTGEVANQSFAQFRIITVIKYNQYQDYDKAKGKQRANKGQAKGNNSTNIQYNNNTKKNIAPSEPEEEFVSDIDWTEEENQMSLKSIRDEEE